MTRVMLMGTFYPLHDGHRHFFSTAKNHGTELYVGVMPDYFIRKHKGREPMYGEQLRLEKVLEESLVNRAFIMPTDEKEKFSLIVSLRPDIYYFGAATYDNEWNKKLQMKLKKNAP